MSRIRLFTLLTASFLAASEGWADDFGYIDCASHPESVQLFGKARQTPDAVGTVPCGERFAILVYGFVFSRIQTKDGKIGYVYSNLITPDRGDAAARVPANLPAANSAATPQAAAKTDSASVTTSPPEKPAAQAGPLFPTPPLPAATPSDITSAPAPAPSPTSAVSRGSQPQPAASRALAAPGLVPPSPASPASMAPAPPQPSSAAQTDPQAQAATVPPQPAASSSSTPPQESSPAEPGSLFPTPPQPAPPAAPSGATDDSAPAPATAAEPSSPPAASQPETAQPRPDPVVGSRVRSSWERPLPGIHQSFLVELYSGYAFDRVSSGGTSSNLSGAMGSIGYNLKPWLQIVADTSYDIVSSGSVKNVLYGNHFGARYFYHRNRWGMTPFAEGLVGGSRFDVTVSGTGGYKTSDNSISYKVGGGIDIRVWRHWEIRAIDIEYYRTSFGGTTQNNYWASAGLVLRLFGSGASE